MIFTVPAGDNEFWSVSISESNIANSIWFDRTNFALDRSKVLWLNADLERRFWFNNAGFANILEMGDYMYIFFWEKAIERKWQVVSRVGRVCKVSHHYRRESQTTVTCVMVVSCGRSLPDPFPVGGAYQNHFLWAKPTRSISFGRSLQDPFPVGGAYQIHFLWAEPTRSISCGRSLLN